MALEDDGVTGYWHELNSNEREFVAKQAGSRKRGITVAISTWDSTVVEQAILPLSATSAGESGLTFLSTTERGEQMLRTLNSLFDELSQMDGDELDSEAD